MLLIKTSVEVMNNQVSSMLLEENIHVVIAFDFSTERADLSGLVQRNQAISHHNCATIYL